MSFVLYSNPVCEDLDRDIDKDFGDETVVEADENLSEVSDEEASEGIDSEFDEDAKVLLLNVADADPEISSVEPAIFDELEPDALCTSGSLILVLVLPLATVCCPATGSTLGTIERTVVNTVVTGIVMITVAVVLEHGSDEQPDASIVRMVVMRVGSSSCAVMDRPASTGVSTASVTGMMVWRAGFASLE